MLLRGTEPKGGRVRTPAPCVRRAGLLLALALAPVASAADPPANQALIAERLPRVVHRGGPFLRRPEITTVTFAGDDPQFVARLEEFGERIVRSAWWREVASGYCLTADDCISVGPAGRAVRLATRLPSRVRDVDLERLIGRESAAGSLSGLNAEALVVVYLPPGVVLSDAFHAQYCGAGPRGYHRMLRGGLSFPYAVIPRCHGEAETTATASHEILEAATNPDPDHPGFRLDSGTAVVGFRAAGTEPVDPCGLLTRDTHRTRESGFTVQRGWSNRAAASGTDPCVPVAAGRPYVTLVPHQPVVRLSEVGATASVVLDAASDRAVPGWTVSAVDLSGVQDGTRYVDARLDRSRVGSGEVAVLTLRVLRLHPRQLSIVGLVSRLGSDSQVWPLAVSTR